MYLRLPPSAFLAVLSVVLAGFTQQAVAQSTAPPTPAAEPLPPLEVTTGQPKKKTAKAKSKSKAPAPVVQAGASPPVVTRRGQCRRRWRGATKPGLNLEIPSTTGSRLGLTPLETPASVEIIPGVTIQERGQNKVVDAVTQNADRLHHRRPRLATAGRRSARAVSSATTRSCSSMTARASTSARAPSPSRSTPGRPSASRCCAARPRCSTARAPSAASSTSCRRSRPILHRARARSPTAPTTPKRFGVGAGGPSADQLAYRLDISGMQSDGWLDQERRLQQARHLRRRDLQADQ